MLLGTRGMPVLVKADGNGFLDATELARSAAATQYSIYLDTLIRTEIVPALQAMGAAVTYVPLMDYTDSAGNLIEGALSRVLPEIAALHGLSADELSGDLLAHRDLIFFDDVHPTAQAHALVAAYSYSLLTGMPWIETLPLVGADVDYRSVASIGAAGEVDNLIVALVAGTTYTFEMLGMSSLGTAGSLADPSLRLLGPNGSQVGADADSGAGFDATLTFTAASSGNYTVELSATGSVTGAYVTQAAVISGAAMLTGNTYTINNALTVVLEGAGGIGQDIVKASISYALSAGSEIETLQTTNDKGKTAINLTGNDFDQVIRGNAGANVIDGKGGADELWGGSGNDRFVLGNSAVAQPDGSQLDRIMDYGRGDIVDVSQVLSVASSVNVLSGGYLRVTSGGLIQVDLDGGGNDWITLGSVNGTGAVSVRYLSGGAAKDISVDRTTAVLTAAVAAAGFVAAPATAADAGSAEHDSAGAFSMLTASSHAAPHVAIGPLVQEGALFDAGESPRAVAIPASASTHSASAEPAALAHLAGTTVAAFNLPHGTDLPAAAAFAVQDVAMPPAEMLQGMANADAIGPKTTGEVERVLVDALSGPDGGVIDALFDGYLAGSSGMDIAAFVSTPTELAAFALPHHAIVFEAMAITPDALPPA